ncbi:MAG TPA: hypothetical protein PKA06_04760 [Gemmatales bacterium]|nr:hypothetical protein [Gemmatales bacterium]HMP16192.1 hypothetical protein [Gemmatales bacterium]
MTKQVLSVGNCAFDFGTLTDHLKRHFKIEMENVDTAEAAEDTLKKKQYNLVMVNRLFDVNQDSGIDFIRRCKEANKTEPMMLISNFPEAQAEAVAVGAIPGFGKSEVGKPAWVEKLKPFLADEITS